MEKVKQVYSNYLEKAIQDEFNKEARNGYHFNKIEKVFITKDNKIIAVIQYTHKGKDLKTNWLVGEVK